MPAVKFRPDIEGLRAIAVLMVLLYHAGFGFSGGFVGVDVFFVVSGFLITTLLIDEGLCGRIRLTRFWARRARRILPASSLVVVAVLAASLWMLEPIRLRELAHDALATAAFVVNVRFTVVGSNYLSGLALPSALQHMWSLAVEEQFYLVWPLVVSIAVKLKRFRRVLGALIAALFSFSFLASAVYTSRFPVGSFYLLPTRAWELLAGAVLALSAPRLSRLPGVFRQIVGWAGLGGMVCASLLFTDDTVFPGVMAVLPVVSTCAFLASGCGSVQSPGRLLAARPLQWIGKRSYSLYLWHWPLLVLFEARFGIMNTESRAAVLALSAALAALTFALVEQPARHSRWLALVPHRSVLYGGALVGIVALSGIMLSALAPTVSTKPVHAAVENVSTSTPQQNQTTTTLPLVDVGRVLLIGDSTLSVMKQYEGGTVALSGFDWKLDAVSCRRIKLRSCQRDGHRPKSVVAVLNDLTLDSDFYDTILVMAGYHSKSSAIENEFADLVASVRRHGAQRLVFMTLRESLAFPAAGTQGKSSVFSDFNSTIRTFASNSGSPQVILFDWNNYAAPQWFRADGIHTNNVGTIALGEFISDSFAAMEGRPCPHEAAVTPCLVAPVGDASIDLLGRYGL